jgi:CO/xanthine dehydrogenase FAD-binding subunit
MEAALCGRAATTEAVEAAAELAGEDFEPPTDVHASSEYRHAMGKVMAARAVLAATREQR